MLLSARWPVVTARVCVGKTWGTPCIANVRAHFVLTHMWHVVCARAHLCAHVVEFVGMPRNFSDLWTAENINQNLHPGHINVNGAAPKKD